jgi:hypothetical protein
MSRILARQIHLLAVALAALCCSSCGGVKKCYPVHGKVLVEGKPAEGVTVVFHPVNDPDPKTVRPSAIVQADGSFALNSFFVEQRVQKDGAPAGQYQVTCIWYPADLQKYLGREIVPDKLNGKYADPRTSGLQAEVLEEPTELPPFELKIQKK